MIDPMKSYICRVCGQNKDYMDMNTNILCKECWVKKEEKKYNESGRKAWITRYKLYGEKGRK